MLQDRYDLLFLCRVPFIAVVLSLGRGELAFYMVQFPGWVREKARKIFLSFGQTAKVIFGPEYASTKKKLTANLVTSSLRFLFQRVKNSRAETPNVIKELFVFLNYRDGNIFKLFANLDGSVGNSLFHSGGASRQRII